jgi:SAM-dependent methyltransferase
MTEPADAPAVACPLCAGLTGAEITTLAFRRKGDLPERLSLHVCRDCDLVFTWPRNAKAYEAYYAEVANDFINSVSNFRNQDQLLRLSRFIETGTMTRVLDFGCGGGGLLAALAARHPDVVFVGFDVNGCFPADAPNLAFTQTMPDDIFDLVILSHVLEHATDPRGMLEGLKPRARNLYVETPCPENYTAVNQPQYLYYIDRLHINHFGYRSLLKAMGSDFCLLEYGRYNMPYDVGPSFPCQYAVFAAAPDPTPVQTAITEYLREQAAGFAAVKAGLQNRRFYVYGFGDNLFRSRSPGGSLHGLDAQVLGVIDRDVEAYRDLLPAGWKAVHPDDIAALNGEMIVCAVTQSTGLDEFLKARCPNSEVWFV